jgi:hypothetical protein
MESLRSLNTLNSFLINISVPIIKCLQQNYANFASEFRTTCSSSRLYASYAAAHSLNPIDDRQKKIFELTNNFMRDIVYIAEHIECGCNNKSSEECLEEIKKRLNNYLHQLILYIDLKAVHAKIVDSATAPGFKEDYEHTKKDLLKRKIDLAEAEQSLLYWQGAVTDVFLSEVLVDLRYTFIEKCFNFFNRVD